MQYDRVLPRDLFNEAKLLKCMGILSLIIHNKDLAPAIMLTHSLGRRGFIIGQSCDGDISVDNLTLHINGTNVQLFTPLNSRDDLPLYAVHNEVHYQVLTSSEENKFGLHEEFAGLCFQLGFDYD